MLGALRELRERLPSPLASSNQGVLYPFEAQGHALVAKTLPPDSRLNAVHRRGLKREFQAYQRLDGIDHFPRCYGLFDQSWLVLERIAGRPFRDAALVRDDAFFDRLLETIRAMHTRGVAHGDLKRKANLIVDRQGRPVILDFGAAVVRKPGFHPFNRRLFEFMRQTDLNAWIKLKYGGYSDVSETDRALLKRTRIERLLTRWRR